jgi:hypothetical protein
MNAQLQEQFDTISTEAMAGEPSLQQALTRLPGFFKEIGVKLKGALAEPIDNLFRPKNLAWAASQLAGFNYADLRTVEMPAIPGVKVDYLTYTRVLAMHAQYAGTIEAQFLTPLITYLAKKLSNPEALRSMHEQNPELDHIVMTDLNALNRKMVACLDTKHDDSEKPYGKLIKRNQDWHEVAMHAAAINMAFSQSDHVRFEAQVDRLNTLLGTLLSRASQDPMIYKLSGPTITRISGAAYITATAVEFYGLTYRRALVLDHTVNEIVDAVKHLTP